ncbi:MAG: disulfide bond formation protein B [Proteobacteria bacterium]|nr:disulfide bond formation protein B [Pseudomonadota bacterium]
MRVALLEGITRRQANLFGFLGCAAMLGCALFFQYVMKLAPCNMCMLQRLAVIELGLVFLIAALHNPGRLGGRIYGGLILVAAAVLAALSARHVWMQMQPAGSLPSCGADFYTMVDMLPFNEVVTRIVNGGGECQAILWSLFGISMPGWLLAFAAVFGLGGVSANLRPSAR